MPRKPKKIERFVKLASDIQFRFENDTKSIIEWLSGIDDVYPDYHRFFIKDHSEYEYQNYELWGVRWETDDEVAMRMRKQAKEREEKARQKAEKEAAERAEYERLKKKFGD